MSRALLPLVLLVLVATGCQTDNRLSDADWIQETAFELATPTNLGGCCLGDLDPERPGREIAFVDASGAVHLVAATREDWSHRLLGRVPGEMIQCAAGDLRPDCPGDELVIVGRAEGDEDTGRGGAAWVFFRQDGGWERELLQETPSLLHAVAIGDLLPGREGLEVILGGYDPAPAIGFAGPKGWAFRPGPPLGGKAKALAVRPDGAVAALANGELVSLRRGEDGWTRHLLQAFDQPLARLATRGDEIAVCDNGGRLHVIRSEGATLVYQDSDRLRGAAFVDIDETHPGVELATAGYRGRIVVVYRDEVDRGGGGDVAVEVGHDPGHRFHHLAAGDVGPFGPVLVACGYAGRVVVLRPLH